MSGEVNSNVTVTLKNVICDYTTGLFEARSYLNSEELRYSISVIVPRNSPAFTAFSNAVAKSLQAVFPKDWEKKLSDWKNNSQKCCFMDGSVKDESRYPENSIVISANRNKKQGPIIVVDRGLKPVTLESGLIYPGCIINTTINIWTQTQTGLLGLRAQAVNVQFVEHGDRLPGGGVATTEGLEVIPDAENDNFEGTPGLI